jgi:hypothetical protein
MYNYGGLGRKRQIRANMVELEKEAESMGNLERLKLLRMEMARCGHKQTDLAKLMPMDKGALSRRMCGKQKWLMTELERLAEIYEKPRLYFM